LAPLWDLSAERAATPNWGGAKAPAPGQGEPHQSWGPTQGHIINPRMLTRQIILIRKQRCRVVQGLKRSQGSAALFGAHRHCTSVRLPRGGCALKKSPSQPRAGARRGTARTAAPLPTRKIGGRSGRW